MLSSNKFNAFVAFLLVLSLVLAPISMAQEAQIDLKFGGYGKKLQEINVLIENIGEVTISDITLYVDGEAARTFAGSLTPGSKMIATFNLAVGEHTIEARTPEGAYDSLTVTAMAGEITTTTTQITTTTRPVPVGKDMLIMTILVIGAMILVIIWFSRGVKEKPKKRKKR